MENFDLFSEDAQDSDHWRLKIKEEKLANPGLPGK